MGMTRREFLKLGILSVILFLVKPWKLIQNFVPKAFLYAQPGKMFYPGKVKNLNRESLLQSSPYAG